LADVGGIAARLSETWPADKMVNPDDAEYRVPPYASYHAGAFDPKHRTVFEVGRPTDASCLNCHATAHAGAVRAQHVGDVHTRAGMSCVDCHRNGLDHAMVRGFAGERPPAGVAVVTCASCHLDGHEHSGRLGAIRAAHRGLPPIHLEKISCTACHSGPLPGAATHDVRTAKANRLGIHGRARWDTLLPEIEAPVLAPGHDGKLTPHRALWPAYWAKLGADGKPMPLLPETVSAAAGDALGGEARIVAVLTAWKALKDRGQPALIVGDKAITLAADGGLAVTTATGDGWMWQDGDARTALAATPGADGQFDNDTTTFVTAAVGALRPLGDACLVIGATRWRLDGDGLISEPHPAGAGPAGWGWLKAGTVTPLIDAATAASAVVTAGTAQSLTEADVARVLAQLAAGDASARFAYIGRGKRWTLDNGQLVSADDAAAQPVLWAIGHDVRPARQALGAVKGCADCHTADSPFLHQQVRVSGPLAGAPTTVATAAFARIDLVALDRFAAGFALRATLKVVLAIAAACVLVGALLVLARALVRRQGAALPGRVPLTIAAHSTLLVLALSGLIAWCTGRPMHGVVLMAHNAAGALFAAALALLALVWLSDAARRGPAVIANWILALCGAMSGLSALAVMLPWADTAGQDALLTLHRVAALAALAAWIAAGALRRVKTA
jgi:hypothetical protein